MCTAPPGITSSAGWKMSRTPPGSSPCSCTSASASAAPTRAVVCTSWPQAWATPAVRLAQGSSVTSWTGSASMSARSATIRSLSPRSATKPVSGSRRTRQPACSTLAAASAVVRVSAQESSGCWWMSRRSSTSSASYFSTTPAMIWEAAEG